jgi:hypothetical protein
VTENAQTLYRRLRERQQALEERAVDASTYTVKTELLVRADEINRAIAMLSEVENGQQMIPGPEGTR